MRLIAVDWSGSKSPSAQRKHIWIADWRDGNVTLTHNQSRDETAQAVLSAFEPGDSLVVGFDFAFAFPHWFTQQLNCSTAPELWKMAKAHGEEWLRECAAPFWGRPAKRCPADHGEPLRRGHRLTEERVKHCTGHRPKSSFQIGGAGAVGTGSVRGMPILSTLREAGFCIWPFDPPGRGTVIEIYPRLSVGKTKVSNEAARREFICSGRFDDMPLEVREKACKAPDAFDALCALRDMVRHCEELKQLRPATSERQLLEGEIWMPRQM